MEAIHSCRAEIRAYTDRKLQLQSKIRQLTAEIKEKELQLSSEREVGDVLKMCSGIEIVSRSDNRLHVKFRPMLHGKVCCVYSLHLHKVFRNWTATFCDLPISCKNVPQELESQHIISISDLWSFLYLSWHEVLSFIERREQFKIANESLHSYFYIFSSIDTLKASMELQVKDGDTNIQAVLYLNYKPYKVRPEKPVLKCQDTPEETKEALSSQLELLQHRSLSDALIEIFAVAESTPQTDASPHKEEGKEIASTKRKNISTTKKMVNKSPKKCLDQRNVKSGSRGRGLGKRVNTAKPKCR